MNGWGLKVCCATVMSLVLVACGGGGGGSDSSGQEQPVQAQPTLTLAQQKERLEGSWTQQCSSPIEFAPSQYGPQSTLNKLTFVGPDSDGLIRVAFQTAFYESTLTCGDKGESPYATVTWGEIELRFEFIGYLADSGQGPVDVYSLSQPSRTVVVAGDRGVTQNPDGTWTITFQDGRSVDIPATEDALPAQVPIHVYAVNSTPYVEMTFNGYATSGYPELKFKRDDRSY